MRNERGELLRAAESRYFTEVNRETIELVAELVDDTVDLSPNDRSASISGNTLSHWCEVEVVTLPDTYESRLVLNFFAKRLLLRHDIISANEEAGDMYRVIIEQGIFKDGFQPLSERSLLLYLPEDRGEEPVALQTYAQSPLGHPGQEDDGLPDFNELIRFTRQINHDFYEWNRLSTFELEYIFDEISVIHTALTRGWRYDAVDEEY